MDFFSFGVFAVAGERGAPITPNARVLVEKSVIPILKGRCGDKRSTKAVLLYVLVPVKITACLLKRPYFSRSGLVGTRKSSLSSGFEYEDLSRSELLSGLNGYFAEAYSALEGYAAVIAVSTSGCRAGPK
jgi:hypothetical protein